MKKQTFFFIQNSYFALFYCKLYQLNTNILKILSMKTPFTILITLLLLWLNVTLIQAQQVKVKTEVRTKKHKVLPKRDQTKLKKVLPATAAEARFKAENKDFSRIEGDKKFDLTTAKKKEVATYPNNAKPTTEKLIKGLEMKIASLKENPNYDKKMLRTLEKDLARNKRIAALK